MQFPILSGIYVDSSPDWRTSYPRNLYPIPTDTGISKGYLRPADGAVKTTDGPGFPRGGIVWNGICYRVMGTKLISVGENGLTTTLGDVGSGGQCSFEFGFDRLAITSGGRLYYWNSLTLTQVTDPDLGVALGVTWLGGYFITTDGDSIVVTELNDPTAVDPLKYGSSETDPDPILNVTRVRNELYALNRFSIEGFENVGGDGFPFQRIDGAYVPRGTIGANSFVITGDNQIAFLGGGRKEPTSFYLAANGSSLKVATREIDMILKTYSDALLNLVVVERRMDGDNEYLMIRLPDRTLVYDAASSKALGTYVWLVLDSSLRGFSQYRICDLIWCYGKWLCVDPSTTNVGYLDRTVASHWGAVVGHDFGTKIAYNGGFGAIVHELELTSLTGATAVGVDPTIWTQYSLDGRNWSQERPRHAGKQGQTDKRLCWRKQGNLKNVRYQRFRWTSDMLLSVARLELQLEPLNG